MAFQGSRLIASLLIFLTGPFTLGGCTWTSHEANLLVDQPAVSRNIAHGTEVFLNVIDDRDEATLGNRGVGRIGAKVTAQDPVGLVERVVRTGLIDKGYVLVADQGSTDKKILVRVRSISFHHEEGFFTGSENTNVVIVAEARNGPQDFTRTYRYSNEDKAMFVAGGGEIDEHLNHGLTKVLAEFLNDGELDRFLMLSPSQASQ